MDLAMLVVRGDGVHDRPCRRLHRATITSMSHVAGGSDDTSVGSDKRLNLGVERRRPEHGSTEGQVEDDQSLVVGKLPEDVVDRLDDLCLLHRVDLALTELDTRTEDRGHGLCWRTTAATP